MRLPARSPRYQHGKSTPRSLRLNDLLWQDFAIWSHQRGWTAAEAVRWLMERAMVADLGSVAKRSHTLHSENKMHGDNDRGRRTRRAR